MKFIKKQRRPMLPCIHGELCKEIYKNEFFIYSKNCPHGCKFYKPIREVRKRTNEKN